MAPGGLAERLLFDLLAARVGMGWDGMGWDEKRRDVGCEEERRESR